ncbi:MFS transporter, partial [Chloroflexota bacterium]
DDMDQDTLANPDNPEYKRNRITTLSLVVLCQGFNMLSFNGISLFLPLIRKDLGLSFTQGGTLAAAATVIYALMQIPAGYLTDRFGSKRLYFIGILGTCTLSFTFGLVTEYWQAIANQLLVGFFRAFLFMPVLVLLSGWFPSNRRATAIGLSAFGTFWGGVLLGLGGPVLVASFGWRFPFLAFAPLGIIAAFAFLRFGKSPPSVIPNKIPIREVFKLFRYKVMWLCGGLQYVRLAVTQGIMFWLPSFLIDEKGMALGVVGLIMVVRATLQASSNVIGGYLSDRLKNPTLVIGGALIILAITSGLFSVADGMVLLITLICINALVIRSYFGPLFSIPIDALGTKVAGVTGGFSNSFANVGSFSSVYIMGLLKDTTGGFDTGFFVVSGIALIGLVFTILLAQIRHEVIVQEA